MPDMVIDDPVQRRELRAEMEASYATSRRALDLLRDIGYNVASLSDQMTPHEIWTQVFDRFQRGAQPGFRTLVDYVLTRDEFPNNPVFRRFAELYSPDPPPPEPDEAVAEPPARDNGHAAGRAAPADLHPTAESALLFVRAENEDERQVVLDLLRRNGLTPRIALATNEVTRFDLGPVDEAHVRRVMDGSRQGWVFVPPGGPAYLYAHLVVEGPDGRRFLFTDTPAATTVADLTQDTLEEYPDSQSIARNAVADRVQPDGTGRRLNPDDTLDKAGIVDGDRLRVGYQTNAGALDPDYRNEALTRAGNQIAAFVDARPGMGMEKNAPDLADWFELEFFQPSYGPPPDPEAEDPQPVPIDEHVVQIELGPDYPQTPPSVYWVTEIFHPNILPNYDSPLARQYPQSRGLVCLGELVEAYEPALHLGRLCQTLLDIAAFKNYSTSVGTGAVVVGADGQLRAEGQGNAFDPVAARWVRKHPEAVAAIGGTPEFVVHGRNNTFKSKVAPFQP